MKNLSFVLLLLIPVIFSCGQRSSFVGSKSLAVRQNDSAVALMKYGKADSSRKAISYLDNAILIDSNYYLAYWNKLILEIQFGNLVDAIEVDKNLIRIKPNAPDLYLTRGILCERIGDSSSTQKYYGDALMRYNIILDTLSPNNENYNFLLINKAVALIMLEDRDKANIVLNKIANTEVNSIAGKEARKLAAMSKKEIIDYLINGYE